MKCKNCDKEIHLALIGPGSTSYRWFTNPKAKSTWHCGSDPKYPLLAHEPVDTPVDEDDYEPKHMAR
jgi:hypothetical protein